MKLCRMPSTLSRSHVGLSPIASRNDLLRILRATERYPAGVNSNCPLRRDMRSGSTRGVQETIERLGELYYNTDQLNPPAEKEKLNAARSVRLEVTYRYMVNRFRAPTVPPLET